MGRPVGLAGADDLGETGPSGAAHEDQEIAGLDRAGRAWRRLAVSTGCGAPGVDHPAHAARRCAAPGSRCGGAGRRRSTGSDQSPSSSSSALATRGQRSTRPGMSCLEGAVRSARRRSPAAVGSSKVLSTSRRIGSAERKEYSSVRSLKRRARRSADARRNIGLHPVEFARIGALEGIDRLLLVAHDEDRAVDLGARAGAGGEFLRQPFDHLPLRRAGVLRLVHEDVVDAAVEPEQHPLRDRRIGQQRPRLVDQVVEIEPAAPLLCRRHSAGRKTCGKAVQRRCLRSAASRQSACCAAPFDPRHEILEPSDPGGRRRGCRLGREACRPCAEQASLRRTCRQAGVFQSAASASRCPGAVTPPQLARCFLHRLSRCRPEASDQLGEQQGVSPPRNTCASRLSASASGGAGRSSAQIVASSARSAGSRRGWRTMSPVSASKSSAGEISREPLHQRRARGRRRAPVDDLGAQQVGGAVVHLGELGRDPASSGKRRSRDAQKEWMVWIFSPPGVSIARANRVRALRSDRRRRRAFDARGRPASARRSVVGQHRPFAEPPEQAVLHLARRGLGVGEAQDVLAAARPSSSSRATRSVSTRVLPEPALAESQVEGSGRAACDLPFAWRRRGSCQHPPGVGVVGHVPFAKAGQVVVVADTSPSLNIARRAV